MISIKLNSKSKNGISPVVGVLLLIGITIIVSYVVLTLGSMFGSVLLGKEKPITTSLRVDVHGNRIVITHLGGDTIPLAFDPEDWWDLNWKYRRVINIDYPTDIIGIFIPYDSDMKADFSDLRFVDSNGNKLRYWIQSRFEYEYAYVWVEVNGNTKIYVYYGNPNAEDESDTSLKSDLNPIFYDDFSTDPNSNGKWNVYRHSNDPINEFNWSSTEEVVYLTKAENSKGVFAFMNIDVSDISNGFIVEFDYKIGGGTGADGIAFGFYKDKEPYEQSGKCSDGGSLALMAYNGTGVQSKGYAVEFDCWNNSEADPSADHIAIINTYESPDPGAYGAKHYATYYTGKVEDYRWHHVKIMVNPNTNNIKVYLDGDLIINNDTLNDFGFDIKTTYNYLGFGAATGGATNNHIIDNVVLRSYTDEPNYTIGKEEIRPTSEPISTWKVKVPINISERSGWDLYDYQVYLKIYYDNEMKPDFSDLRFVDENGNELAYWIEEMVDGKYAIVWVKVPYIPANGNTTIYMLYGNPTAESMSNPRDTMLIYEDMSVPPSGNLYGTAYYDSENKWVRLTENKPDQKGIIVYGINPGVGFYAKIKFWAYGGTCDDDGGGADAVWIGVYDNDIDSLREDIVSGGYHFTFDEYQDRIAFTKSTEDNGNPIKSNETHNIDNGEWHVSEVWFYKNKTNSYCYATIVYDGETVIRNAVDTNPQSLTGLFTTFGARTGGCYNEHRIKFILMRKYVYPEPNVTIGGKVVSPLFTTKDWINMEVRVNGKLVGINQEYKKAKLVDAKLNGQRLVPGKIYNFKPGDVLELDLFDKLEYGDRITIIYKPARQILVTKEVK